MLIKDYLLVWLQIVIVSNLQTSIAVIASNKVHHTLKSASNTFDMNMIKDVAAWVQKHV